MPIFHATMILEMKALGRGRLKMELPRSIELNFLAGHQKWAIEGLFGIAQRIYLQCSILLLKVNILDVFII